MGGKAAHAIDKDGYTLHMCSAMCKANFEKNLDANLAGLAD
jgi:YHS domain-containing protein